MTEPGPEKHSRDHIGEPGPRPADESAHSLVVDACLEGAL